MKGIAKGGLVSLLGVALTLGVGLSGRVWSRGSVLKAHADIEGAPGSGISGEAQFIQTEDGILPNVMVIVHVNGLPADTTHGIHIHEIGICASPFSTAGGHFDPGPFGQSNPDANHPFHMGDLPNLVANSAGVASLETRTNRVTLSPGPLSIFDANGSAIIIKANPDQGITGAPGSGVSGGPRIACGVIQPDD